MVNMLFYVQHWYQFTALVQRISYYAKLQYITLTLDKVLEVLIYGSLR